MRPVFTVDAKLGDMNRTVPRTFQRTVKLLLLWLLISALPMQGFAAALSVSCGPAIAQAPVHAAHQHQAAPQPPAASDDCACASDTASCSACAACCPGASVATGGATAPAAPAMSEAFVSTLAVPGAGVIPAGLERPPKPG